VIAFARKWERIVLETKNDIGARHERGIREFLEEIVRKSGDVAPGVEQATIHWQEDSSHANDFRFIGRRLREVHGAKKEIFDAFDDTVELDGHRGMFVGKEMLVERIQNIAQLFDDDIQENIREYSGIPRAQRHVMQFNPSNALSLMTVARDVCEQRRAYGVPNVN
jgi:hypothetical protein